jgi:hypothetical protein
MRHCKLWVRARAYARTRVPCKVSVSCAWALAPREHVVGGGAYHATHGEDEQRDSEDSLDLEPTVSNKVAMAHSRWHMKVRGTASHALPVCAPESRRSAQWDAHA